MWQNLWLKGLLSAFVGVTLLALFAMGGCTKKKAQLIYPAGPCDTTNVTYSSISAMINAKCGSCHPGQSAALDSYTALKSYASNSLERVMAPVSSGQHMPLNGTALSDCEIAQLRQWIAQGYKQ